MHHVQGAPTTFQDLDGLHIMVERLALEAGVCAPTPIAAPSDAAPEGGEGGSGAEGGLAMATDDVPSPSPAAAADSAAAGAGAGVAAGGSEPSALPASPPAVLTKEPPQFPAPKLSALQAASAPPPAVALPYPRKVLLKFLLRSIAITSYSHGTANAARPNEVGVRSVDGFLCGSRGAGPWCGL